MSGDEEKPHVDMLEEARARRDAKKNADIHLPTGELPTGWDLDRLTLQRNHKGEIVQYWEKRKQERATHEHVMQAFELALQDRPLPEAEPLPAPEFANDDLITMYPMGDPHLGLHTWAPEVGASFDLRKASHNLRAAVTRLSLVSPPSHTALIANMGDFFHADNKRGQTERSGHILDMDTRLPKVIAVGIDTMVACVEAALTKHIEVYVYNVPGNHDELSAFWLSMCLERHFRNEPRVHVETSPAKHLYHRFGNCLIGMAHGDTEKPKDLPGMMACDRAADWGETKHRAFWLGHVHHQNVFEFPGCMVESFNTLAPADSHARAHPKYRSRRCMIGDVWHKEFGPITRNQVGILEIEGEGW